jgi:hypothetical protein
MAYFRTAKIPIWVNFWWVLQWKMLVYFLAIRSIFTAIWHILWYVIGFIFCPVLVCCTKKKTGNPTIERRSTTRCTRHPAQNWKGFYLSFLSLPRTTYSSTKIMQYIVFFIIMYTLIEYVRNSVIGSKGEKPHLSIGWFGFHGGPFFRHEYFSSKSLITFLLGRRSE